jgi:hypothetical protein
MNVTINVSHIPVRPIQLAVHHHMWTRAPRAIRVPSVRRRNFPHYSIPNVNSSMVQL